MHARSTNFEQNSLAGISIQDLEHIINSSSESIVSLDLDFKIKYANYSFKSMASKAFDVDISYNTTSFFDLIPHFLHSHYRELLSNVLNGDTIKNDTYRSFPNRNLPEAYYEEAFMPIRNEEDAIVSIYVFIRDITQKYKTELQLAENEAILMGVFDSSSDEIVSVNTKCEVTSFNKKAAETFEKMTGKRVFIGTNLVRHFETQGLDMTATLFKRRLDKGLNGDRFTEMDAYEIDGATKYVEILINPVYINDSVIGISIFSRDVTQKMLSDRRILENDAFLKSVQNLAQIGTWRHNLKSGDFSCSSFCFEIFGVMPSIKPTKALFDGMLGSENVKRMQESISDFLKSGKSKPFDIKLRFSENYQKYLTCFINPIVSEKGELLEIVYVLQDVTPQKRTQKELDKTNELLNTLMDSVDYAVISINDLGIATSFNKAAEKITGYKAAEIIGKNSPLLWHDQEDLIQIAEKISNELGEEIAPGLEVLIAKSRKGLKNEIDSVFTSKDGRKVPVQLSISALYDKKKNIVGYVGMARDVTEKLAFETKLKEQNILLNTIIDSLPFDFWARDSDQKMIIQNAKSVEYWGDHYEKEFHDQEIPAEIIRHWEQNNKRAFAGEMIRNETIFHVDGKDTYIDEIIVPIFGDNKTVTGILGINIDINERKNAELKLKKALEEEIKLNKELACREEELSTKEEELRQSLEELISVNDFIEHRERQISAIFDNSPDIILSIDKNLCVTIANKTFRDLYFKVNNSAFRQGVLVKSVFINEEGWQVYQSIYARVLNGESVSNTSDVIEEPFNRYVSEEYYSPIKNEYDEITGVAIFIKDITQKVLAEEKTRKTERLFESVINSSPDFISFMDRDLVYQLANTATIDFIKKITKLDIVTGKSQIKDVVRPEYIEIYKDIYGQAFDGKIVRREIARPTANKDEPFIYTDENYYPVYDENNEIIGVASSVKDITDKVNAENKAKAYQLKFLAVLNSSTDYIILINRDMTIGAMNTKCIESVKQLYKVEVDFDKTIIFDVLPQAMYEGYKLIFEQVLLGESKFKQFKHDYEPPIDSVYTEEHYFPIINDEGEVTGISLFAADVTEKVRNQEKINKQEKRFTSVINSTDIDGILVIDRNYVVIDYNKTYEKVMSKNFNITLAPDKFDVFELLPHQFHADYKAIFDNVLKGETQHKTNAHPVPVDKFIYTNESFFPIYGANNEVAEIAVFIRDTTHQVKFQKKIEASEEMLRQTQQLANLGSWKYVIATESLTWSDCTYKIYEIEPNTKISLELFRSLFSKEIASKTTETLQNAIAAQSTFTMEANFTSLSGKQKYLIGIGNPVFDKDGHLVEYMGTVQDITERRSIELNLVDSLEEAQKLNETLAQREEQLTANEEELRAYVEELSQVNTKLEQNDILLNKNLQLLNLTGLLSKVGGWEYDSELKKYYITDHLYKLFDITHGNEHEIINNYTFYTEEDKKLVEQKTLNLLTKGDPYDYELSITTAKGEKIWIRSIGYADMRNKKVIKGYGAIQDITKRKQDQQRLIESETNLKAIINNTVFGIWAVDAKYNLIAFNEVFAKEYFANRGIVPIVGMNLFQNVQPFENIEKTKLLHERALKGEKFYIEVDSNNTTYDCFFSPITREDGTVRGVAVIINDISERKIIEKQIKTSEGKFRALFEKSKVSMMLIDGDNVLDCNEQTLKLFQISDKSELNSIIAPVLNGSSFKDFTSVNKSENIQKLIDRYHEVVFEWTHSQKDGTQLYGEIRITPIEVDGKEILFSQFYDLTERKLAETKILESENFLNSIIDNIPIGLLIIDEFGEVKRMNSATLGLTDVPKDWYLRGGINFLENPFLQQVGASFYFKKAMQGDILINEELEIDFGLSVNEWNIRDDKAWFLVTVFPIHENNKVKNVVVALIDITADKKNEEKIKSNALELIASNKKMAEYKLMALRSVMNPHFLFNSLNSIQYFIAKNDREQALNYLSLFSKLIRSILNSSIDNSHSLSEEISILRFYTDLETLRFEDKFKTLIEIDKEIDQENIEIPSLILQPYVENAILHGLYNKKETSGVLKLSFKLTPEKNLLAIIEDNGVGRIEALGIKQASKMHRSVGMLVTEERLELINKDNNLNVTIIDLKDEEGKPSGTRVEVLFNI